MKIDWKSYTGLILLHVILAVVVFGLKFVSKIYGLAIPAVGALWIYNTQNRNNEALIMAAYVVGSEVFLRMTGGNLSHELAKYEVIFFMTLGVFYSGMSKGIFIYILFLLLLLPGVYIGATSLRFDVNVRKAILFNILGEVTLFFSALYCYQRTISFKNIEYLLKAFALPIVSVVIYLILFNPSIKDVVTNTQSSYETSGGFGPNQVSTILGLGMFCFFALALFYSKTRTMILLNVGLFMITSFRGLATFSRGGVMTGAAMIVVLGGLTYVYLGAKARSRFVFIAVVGVLIAASVWTYSVVQTGGLIENRYANKDARGREKSDRLGGREEIALTELQMFLDNPIFGIGVGKNKEYREEVTGIVAASHNEFTRLLAEHGSLGILAFVILIAVPILLNMENKQHIFWASFLIFWGLTLNHAAMRLAAPAFVYALSLLRVKFTDEEDETTLPREQTK